MSPIVIELYEAIELIVEVSEFTILNKYKVVTLCTSMVNVGDETSIVSGWMSNSKKEEPYGIKHSSDLYLLARSLLPRIVI